MLKIISVQDLRLGMYLHELQGSWLNNPFWRSSRLLDEPDDIQRILESGIESAVIDVTKGTDAQPRSERTESVVQARPPGRLSRPNVDDDGVSFEQELARATHICTQSRQAVLQMFTEARMGAVLNNDLAITVVEEIAGSVLRNSHALISLARLKSQDDYTYMHSVAVCALMIGLARQLNMNEAEIKQAGLAGLTHDIGKIMLPVEVLKKPGSLTEEEFRCVKTHPQAGHKLLSAVSGMSEIALDVCLHHHEKMDGTGYPHGLAGEAITLHARMGAVCDVYDAITSNRSYKAGWCPAESIRKMASWANGHFDPRIFQAFVKTVGIYPVGTLVKLTSGRLAVVTDQRNGSLLKPVVMIFFSTKSGTYLKPTRIDLGRAGEKETIVMNETPAKWGLSNLDRFWQA